MLEQHLVNLLVKLAVAASVASIFCRSEMFRRSLMREERTLSQRVQLALGCGAIFGAGVLTRILSKGGYKAVDLGMEGAFLAGILGGYVTGLLAGILISVPAMAHGEYLSMPLFAGLGVMGGLLRDSAPEPDDVWRLSPFFDLTIYRIIRTWQDKRRALYQLSFLGAIVLAETSRLAGLFLFGSKQLFVLWPEAPSWPVIAANYISTSIAIALPLQIWNSSRNERKLANQQRLLNEARLQALSNQINPHFLFNTLNTITSLVRVDPEQARTTILKLSRILRRVLRKSADTSPLREELAFIEDYLAIEIVRFGPKLRFIKEVDPETLDCPVPSMLLQPLIENSLRHGLSSKVDGGMIRVRSRLVDGKLLLLVEDDGVGMSEARLATLFEQGIGVSNVNERLKVLFGTQYRMWIDSKPGEGTRTEIEIPGGSPALAAAS